MKIYVHFLAMPHHYSSCGATSTFFHSFILPPLSYIYFFLCQCYKKSFLLCNWYSNKKARMTCAVFSDYLKNKFNRELEVYCKNLSFKILLVLDNAHSLPSLLADVSENIKLAFLPPNMTSLIQPFDQGIVQTFKSYYLRLTLVDLLKVTEQQNLPYLKVHNFFFFLMSQKISVL